MLIPRKKLRVFVSSKCGVGAERYDKIRLELKKLIEETNLAEVYLFESEEASTLTAGQHYLWSLEESDICIFLIDNGDGVPKGVQKEIDCAKKYKIKSLYYFCDETTKEKTPVENSLIGFQFVKTRTVNSFEELLEHSAQALIDDIVFIYRNYCKGRLIATDENNTEYEIGNDVYDESLLIEKSVLKNTDKCHKYFLKLFSDDRKSVENTSELDEWCVQFLPILFEHASIRNFNVAMLLEVLRKFQSEELNNVVEKRWKAIQSYFAGNIEDCIKHIEEALDLAKNNKLSEWIINDILIDLRNYRIELWETQNRYPVDDPAQKELNDSKHLLYYPIIDRLRKDMYEKCTDDAYKERTKSEDTITWGYNFTQASYLSDSFVVAMFNGSLTYLLLLHKEMKELYFALSCEFSDWDFRKNLLKETIFIGSNKNIKEIYRTFPDISSKLNSVDALEIYDYCNNHTQYYKNLESKMRALSAIGYYLSDEDFAEISTEIISEINKWFEMEEPVVSLGFSIVECLDDIADRLTSEDIAQICIKFFEKNYLKWYPEVFRIISRKIQLAKLSKETAIRLVNYILLLIDDNMTISTYNNVLISFRKQNAELTNDLDKVIAKKNPEFYNNEYKLETTVKNGDISNFLKKYVQQIISDNEKQGKGGVFYSGTGNPCLVIRNMLLMSNTEFDFSDINAAFVASCQTLLCENQDVKAKCYALDLIIFLLKRYPEIKKVNEELLENIKDGSKWIERTEGHFFTSNISSIALQFSYNLFMTCFDNNAYLKFLELLPYISDDIPSLKRICNSIKDYLESDKSAKLNSGLESIILQSALSWIGVDNINVKCASIDILFLLLRNEDLISIIGIQMTHLIDNESVYVRNVILRNISDSKLDNATKEYIMNKCLNDSHFVIRKNSNDIINNKM